MVLPLVTFALVASSLIAISPLTPYMIEGQPLLAPFAHVVFCLKYPRECLSKGDSSVVEYTPSLADHLNSVNQGVNQTIAPMNDPPGEDNWDVATVSGDCEDYAITKRKRLIDSGLPSAATRLAVAVTPEGIGHVVLIERTTIGDLVLDNRVDEIKPWQDVDLTWIELQSADNPKMWVDISGDSGPSTSSLVNSEELSP